MLNTCTSRVWFVVELCEAIQAEKIELANFELFSSSPKDFSVFVGDRFPSRDWSQVGQFTAKDERDIQSFHLDPRLFGKFVKVELHSHYGSEHFCPVSLFRVYGTSEFEVLETENQIQESLNDNDDDDDDDEEEMLDSDPPRNLFGSARDAVLSIVKKAAQVLVKSGENKGENQTDVQKESKNHYIDNTLSNNCATPKFSIICNNCQEPTSAEAYRLISCHDNSFVKLLRSNFINETLSKGDICLRSNETNDRKTINYPPARFLAAIFSQEHIIALCNIFYLKSNRNFLKSSLYVNGNSSEASAAAIEDSLIDPPNGVKNDCEGESITESKSKQEPVYCTLEESGSTNCKTSSFIPSFEKLKNTEDIISSTSSIDEELTTDNVASLIKPTKTFERINEGSRRESFNPPILEPSRKSNDESTIFDSPTTISPIVKEKSATVDKVNELLFGF